MAGTDATEYVRLLLAYIWPRPQTYTLASARNRPGINAENQIICWDSVYM